MFVFYVFVIERKQSVPDFMEHRVCALILYEFCKQ